MTQTSDETLTEKARKTAGDAVADVTDAAADKVKSEASAARDTVAEETSKAASAAQAAADEFDGGSVQAQAIEQVARRIDDLAAQIRSTDIDRMARSLGDAAQRNPLMFVAGAALAGFAVTRFLGARGPDRSRSYNHDDPWQSVSGDAFASAGHDPASRGAV